MKVLAMSNADSTVEAHFMICLYLMIFFFLVDLGTSALVALHITMVQIGGGEAHDAYIAFFGIALGIFRGMTPASGELPPNSVKQTETATTVTQVSPPATIPISDQTKISPGESQH
jgi:hypothetical protein